MPVAFSPDGPGDHPARARYS